MKRDDFLLDTLALLSVIITTIIAIVEGKTLSRLQGTDAEFTFLLGTITSSISLWRFREWRASSITLILLSAFSVHKWGFLHNLFSVLFFSFSVVVILRDKRLRNWSIGFLLSAFAAIHSLLAFEVVGISTIIGFHIHYYIIRSAVYEDRL